jgi:hypothetical protein
MALLIASHELAEAEGVAAHLEAEWTKSIPELAVRHAAALRARRTKGWRWVNEMEQIADAMGGQGLPSGFHVAAAEVFRRWGSTAGSSR